MEIYTKRILQTAWWYLCVFSKYHYVFNFHHHSAFARRKNDERQITWWILKILNLIKLTVMDISY